MSDTPVISEFSIGDRAFDLKGAMKSGESVSFRQYYRTIETVNALDKTVTFVGDNPPRVTEFSLLVLENQIESKLKRNYFRLALVMNHLAKEKAVIFTKEDFIGFFKQTGSGNLVSELKKYGEDSVCITNSFLEKEISFNEFLVRLNEQVTIGKIPKLKNMNQWRNYIKQVYEKAKEKIIGQDEAVKELVLRITHYVMDPTQKEPILLAGPTGSGKTYSLKIICEFMGLPFRRIVLPQLTSSGYKGNNVQDVIFNELNALKSQHNGVLPPQLVLQLDEFDKIVLDEYFSKLLQNEFLPLLEDNAKVRVYAAAGAGEMKVNALPIISGAFSYVSSDPKENLSDEALRKFGFIDEIIGRLGSRVFLKQLEIEDYKKMLNSNSSDLMKVLKSLSLFNVEIEFDNQAINEIALLCHENKLGARYLVTIVKDIVTEIENYLAFEDKLYCGLEVVQSGSKSKIIVKKEFILKENRDVCEVKIMTRSEERTNRSAIRV